MEENKRESRSRMETEIRLIQADIVQMKRTIELIDKNVRNLLVVVVGGELEMNGRVVKVDGMLDDVAELSAWREKIDKQMTREASLEKKKTWIRRGVVVGATATAGIGLKGYLAKLWAVVLSLISHS